MKLTRIDHVDLRVPSLAAVEPFYDALLPALGLARKTASHVGADGEWYEVGPDRPRNVAEYHTPLVVGERGWFIGIIEDSEMQVTKTRVAFALDDEAHLAAMEPLVRQAGGRIVEWSAEPGYPALFFEDPLGTRLEICARRPH